MNKTMDEFSKNLATGVSRRKALLSFLGGAGALGFLAARKAKAIDFPTNPANCGPFCLEVASFEYSDCVSDGGSFATCFPNLSTDYERCLKACQHRHG